MMTKITSGTVRSADGTTIAFDRSGTGPAVIFVHGALTDRTFPVLGGLAAALAPRLTVFNAGPMGAAVPPASTAPQLPGDFRGQLDELVRAGRAGMPSRCS